MSIRTNNCLLLDDCVVETWEQMQQSYARRREQHGCSPAAMYYSRDTLHQERLEQVAVLLKQHVAPQDSVLDVGCGFGDLVPHLPECRYLGLDVIEEAVQEARRRHPSHDFRCGNLLDMEHTAENRFHWLAMVGIMGTLPLPEEVLQKGLALAHKGVIVDFIDAAKSSGPLNAYDMGCCVNFLLQRGAGQVLVHATPSQPWTFVVALKDMLFVGS